MLAAGTGTSQKCKVDNTALANRTKWLVAAVVRMALEDGERAVDLLEQHDAGEFVWESHLPEREVGAGGLARCIAEAVRGADGEDQRLGVAVLMILQKFSKLFGRKFLAP